MLSWVNGEDGARKYELVNGLRLMNGYDAAEFSATCSCDVCAVAHD